MADLDELARRMAGLVANLADRGVRWAVRVAVLVALAAVATYLLGLAALDGPVGRVWPVLGAVIGLAAIAAPVLAAWRLRSVRKGAPELVSEVRTLMGRNADAQRVVIDTVETRPSTGERSVVVYQNRDFGDLRRMAVNADDLRALPGALAAVTTFPGLLIIGVLATLAFGFVSLIFLIALAF